MISTAVPNLNYRKYSLSHSYSFLPERSGHYVRCQICTSPGGYVLLNNLNANYSAELDEFRDLLTTEFELENLNIKDFELLNSNHFKMTLMSITPNSEGAYLLYFPKIMCDKCIQDEIQKVYEKCSRMSNFYSIIPLNIAREIRSTYKNMNEDNIYYYAENFLLLKEPVKPIILHIDKNCTVDRAYVLQKINVEFNLMFLKTL